MRKKTLLIAIGFIVLLTITGSYMYTKGRMKALENKIEEFRQNPLYATTLTEASDSLNAWHDLYLVDKASGDASSHYIGEDSIVHIGPIVFNSDFTRCIVIFISRGTVNDAPVLTSSLMAGEKNGQHWNFYTDADKGDLPTIAVLDDPGSSLESMTQARTSALDHLIGIGLISFPMLSYDPQSVDTWVKTIADRSAIHSNQ